MLLRRQPGANTRCTCEFGLAHPGHYQVTFSRPRFPWPPLADAVNRLTSPAATLG